MFISPIQPIGEIGEISGVGKTQSGESSSLFKGILETAVKNVVETDLEVAEDVYALATGQTDDVHNLLINQSKAQLAIDLMVQLRNGLMDAYSEIMRINL